MGLREKLFSFEGRLRRQDYWLISISLGLAVFAVTEIVMWVFFGPRYSLFSGGYEAGALRVLDVWPYAVQILLNLVTFWPSLAMSAERAHDRNKSAWLIVSLLVVFEVYWVAQPLLIGWQAALSMTPSGQLVDIGLMVLSLAATIYIFVTVGCLDGTRGPNRYGPSPKAAELAGVAT